jgi:hypothetical protein
MPQYFLSVCSYLRQTCPSNASSTPELPPSLALDQRVRNVLYYPVSQCKQAVVQQAQYLETDCQATVDGESYQTMCDDGGGRARWNFYSRDECETNSPFAALEWRRSPLLRRGR